MPEQRGFTLIELLVTFTVLAIILGIGVPGLRDFIFNNRQVSALNEMVASLQYGRTEAIARNNTVSLCPSTNGTSCTGASTWDVGWIIFSDSDADGTVDGGTDTVLRVVEGLDNLDLGFDNNAVTYRRNGRAQAGTIGTFRLCDARGAAKGKQIIMDLAGRPRAEKLTGKCPT
jgi:type IV fimbrial biogenesis protein FimT